MWKLSEEKDNKRVYSNSITGSRCEQTMCYTDKDSNKWWHFTDMILKPYSRYFQAQKVSALYALGLSRVDLDNHITGLKTLLKSDDKEKYEKIFANVLDFQTKANNATDAVKQMSALTCVYFTLNDEPIDAWDNTLQIKKMSLLEADTDMHTFFLNLQIDATQNYSDHLSLISQIAFQNPKEL